MRGCGRRRGQAHPSSGLRPPSPPPRKGEGALRGIVPSSGALRTDAPYQAFDFVAFLPHPISLPLGEGGPPSAFRRHEMCGRSHRMCGCAAAGQRESRGTKWLRLNVPLTVTNGQIVFEDGESVSLPRRFYRVIER